MNNDNEAEGSRYKISTQQNKEHTKERIEIRYDYDHLEKRSKEYWLLCKRVRNNMSGYLRSLEHSSSTY